MAEVAEHEILPFACRTAPVWMTREMIVTAHRKSNFALRKERMNLVTTPPNIVLPLKLEGSVVRLEPIRREHARVFWEVAQNDAEDIFRWIPYAMKTPEDFERVIDKALEEQERGESWCLPQSSANQGA